MSVTGAVRTVPRTVVGAYLQVARLPITVAARVTGHHAEADWGPALAYEKLQGSVESRLGSLLRDDALAVKGRLRQEKVVQLRRAVKLEEVAEEQREQADDAFEHRREQAEEDRAEAARRAEQRERELERQAELHERKAQEKAAKKAAVARELKAEQDKAIARRERVARSATLSKESQAVKAAATALDAERTVDVIEATLEGAKVERKAR